MLKKTVKTKNKNNTGKKSTTTLTSEVTCITGSNINRYSTLKK